MTRLTPHMRAALEQAQHAPLRRVHKPGPGAPPWPAAPNTLRALTRRGLLQLGHIRNRDGWPMDTWTLSDAGRAALQPVEIFRVERPTYLARPTKNTGDYTHDPSRRIDHLPVASEASPMWRRRAQERYAGNQNPVTAARRLGRNIRAAA